MLHGTFPKVHFGFFINDFILLVIFLLIFFELVSFSLRTFLLEMIIMLLEIRISHYPSQNSVFSSATQLNRVVRP